LGRETSLGELDMRLLETLAKCRRFATAKYLADKIYEPLELVSQHLAQLGPIVLREKTPKTSIEGRVSEVWAYSLRNPHAAAMLFFGEKTCPHPSMLKVVE